MSKYIPRTAVLKDRRRQMLMKAKAAKLPGPKPSLELPTAQPLSVTNKPEALK